MPRLRSLALIGFAATVLTSFAAADDDPARWTPEAAQHWQASHPWLVGCNYIPATAVNPIEMWQAETFDPARIDRELAWAHKLGFNSVRVFLHILPWQEDPEGFLNRVDRFLRIAAKHHITALPVLFDACWNPHPHTGPQPAPKPHTHNSQWVQCPGVDLLGHADAQGELEAYVKSVVGHFRADRRVIAWDLFNEPDNGPDATQALNLALLRDTFAWARAVDPRQPLTVGLMTGTTDPATPPSAIAAFAYAHDDVISFHCYAPLPAMRAVVTTSQREGRPLLCTEYLARPMGSTFETILPYLKEQHVAAYNWGFVSGKTQTIYPWDSAQKTYTAEPPEWFHDILRADGTPFRESEAEFLKKLLLR